MRIVKSIYVLLLVALPLSLFTGCDKDEELSITGIWNVDYIMNNGIIEVEPVVYHFSEDGTGFLEELERGEEGIIDYTWVIDGNNLTMKAAEWGSIDFGIANLGEKYMMWEVISSPGTRIYLSRI